MRMRSTGAASDELLAADGAGLVREIGVVDEDRRHLAAGLEACGAARWRVARGDLLGTRISDVRAPSRIWKTSTDSAFAIGNTTSLSRVMSSSVCASVSIPARSIEADDAIASARTCAARVSLSNVVPISSATASMSVVG